MVGFSEDYLNKDEPMNYFAHGYTYLDRPYLLAGTAVPDWLSAVDRKVRVGSRHARPFTEAEDPRMVALATGILQHHQDDEWFHENPAFVELNTEASLLLKPLLPADHRPLFVGHVLVEMLLDAALIERNPARLNEYYLAVGQIDALWVQQAVNQMAVRQTENLVLMIQAFLQEQFLADYLRDDLLLKRLNRVVARVKLPSLPAKCQEVVAETRRRVNGQVDRLVAPAAAFPRKR